MAEAKSDIEKLKILTSEFRVSHPHVFEPSAIKGSQEKNYSIEMLFDKTKTDLKALQAPLLQAAVDKWGSDRTQWPKPLLLPIRDGDKPHGKKKEIKPEHVGMWVVKASSSGKYSRPHVVGTNSKIPLNEPADLYPGCYARAALKAHAYTFMDKDGVKFILDGVQKIRDGKAMGGRKPADQVFGNLEPQADDGEGLIGDDGGFDAGEAEEQSFM